MAQVEIKYSQFIKALDHMDASQLKGVMYHCQKHLKQREQDGETWDEYELGREQGKREERQEAESMLKLIASFIVELSRLNASIGAVRGAVMAGAGKAQRETFKHFAGMVQYCYERVELTRADILAQKPYLTLDMDMNFRDRFSKATKLFYVKGDPSDMFVLPGDEPQLLDMYTTITELKPGIRKDNVIVWLCQQLDDICSTQGCFQTEGAEILYNDLLGRSSSLKGMELKGWQRLKEWEEGKTADYADNLLRNYGRWKKGA